MSLKQWETYYRGGLLATGPAGPDGLYDLEVRAAWESFFSALPQQARLLDIGTGNGVLPLIALQVAAQRGADWQIDATDLAQIDPPRYVADGARRFAGVRFHAGVGHEKLPFDEASFDAVCGHYALEYGDTAAALQQLHRVLKPGAEAQFVLHHSDSRLVQSARRSLQECHLVLKETRLYRKLHRLVSMDQAPSSALQAAGDELVLAIRALKQALASTQANGAGSGHILAVALDAAQKLLSARQSLRPSAVGLEVDRAEEELRSSARRLNDLVGHALDEAAVTGIERQAQAVGFSLIERQLLHHNVDNLVGWQLSMHRA